MTDRTVLVHRGVFAAVDGLGEISGTRGTAPDGLFARDARHLSRWRLRIDGAPLTRLAPGVLVPEGTRDRPPAFAVFRAQALGAPGLAEELRIANHGGEPLAVRVRYSAAADFADQFELRADERRYPKPEGGHGQRTRPDGVEFRYRRGDWLARTEVAAAPAPDAVTAGPDGAELDWTLTLPAHGSAVLALTVRPVPAGTPGPDGPIPVPVERVRAEAAAETAAFAEPPPAPPGADPDLARVCAKGLADLAGLRVPAPGPGGAARAVPGAGVPWFLTLFGRDSLLTSLFALPYRPALAAATLPALAAVQGRRHDPSRLEQPGRIVHEVRHGELAHFGQVPYARYYGSIDSTPLFLVLLHAYTEATGDTAPAAALQGAARAAVAWMFADGGLDEHGYLTYRPDPGGLVNQCWKDSDGAVCTADGRQAEGPIAVVEAQGYAFDALRRTAVLAADVWGDPGYADRLRAAAARLRAAVHRDFPMERHGGFPALALDGDRRQVDVLASNAGHLLFSGLLDTGAGRAVGRRLLEPDFFSGWGVRTLAAGQRPYHPLSYHRGSIWPHDNAVIVAGLARYGLAAEAARVARGLVGAAVRNGDRLPEVLGGHDRAAHPDPVPYPHSCSPQAWAAAAPLVLLAHERAGAD
ncbi:glycogen debranching enzyme [Murinocardiopsis flavida]|uniref:Glycogen debranching enzyme n=1 Tax=Murinocardiopsis flavida TaxID=645275 RepID=A0A2P8DFF3_9ACTN|nr:glycogen debranching N-terminal domain-containing protein [Murinocardiopsis flavida]PSK95951.1 glycogen debranching enzyme [Murinocardiopsis flavida]